MTCLRVFLVLVSVVITGYGAVLQGKPIGVGSLAGLFVVCSGFAIGMPCIRRLDQRFCAKHGLDFMRWMHYGWLGVVHGTSRWLLIAIFIGKLIDVSRRGWWVLLQMPALLVFGLALYCGYPGLESFGLAVKQRSLEKAWWWYRRKRRPIRNAD